MNYSEKLRDPRWQKIRLQVMNRDLFTCQMCFTNTLTLNVHHRIYIPGHDPWEYPLYNFLTLCEPCHERETVDMKQECNNLLLFIKSCFLSHHVRKINKGIRELTNSSDCGADILLHFLTDPDRIKFLLNEYSKSQNTLFGVEVEDTKVPEVKEEAELVKSGPKLNSLTKIRQQMLEQKNK